MTVDLTTKMKNKVVAMLRTRLTDRNSTNRVGSQWIYPDKPRVDLTKNSYPRIAVLDVNEEREIMDIAENTSKINELAIRIYIWGNIDDPMLLTISSTVYEGEYLADYIREDVKETIETYFSDLRAAVPCPHSYALVGERDVADPDDMGRIIKELRIRLEWE